MTTYNMIPTQNLPLLDPLRIIPGHRNRSPTCCSRIEGHRSTGATATRPTAGRPGRATSKPRSGSCRRLGHPRPWVRPCQWHPAGIRRLHGRYVPRDPSIAPALSLPALSLPALSNAITATCHRGRWTGMPTPNAFQSHDTGFSSRASRRRTPISSAAFTGRCLRPLTGRCCRRRYCVGPRVTLPSYDFHLFHETDHFQAVNGTRWFSSTAIGDPSRPNVGLATVAGGFELIPS